MFYFENFACEMPVRSWSKQYVYKIIYSFCFTLSSHIDSHLQDSFFLAAVLNTITAEPMAGGAPG